MAIFKFYPKGDSSIDVAINTLVSYIEIFLISVEYIPYLTPFEFLFGFLICLIIGHHFAAFCIPSRHHSRYGNLQKWGLEGTEAFSG